MSLFTRVANFIRTIVSRNEENTLEVEIRDEVASQFGEEDELVDIWQNTVEDNIGDVEALHEFTLDQHGADLFRIGWAEDGENEEDRANAREEFFELMEAYDISRDEFDWDAWRDWYEDA